MDIRNISRKRDDKPRLIRPGTVDSTIDPDTLPADEDITPTGEDVSLLRIARQRARERDAQAERPGRLGGRIASKYYAARRLARDQERERLRLKEIEPKAIEARLRAQRERPRRRTPFSRCPNVTGRIKAFLRDPVTRFWLVYNICWGGCLFGGSALFMVFIYPVTLRPILKY